jgi:signal transduction histidine kinase/DNA-binding response OmpR family regulator
VPVAFASNPTISRNTIVYALIALSMGGVLLADRLTPLGYAVWIFYLVPVALCALLNDPRAPLLVAALSTVAIVIGYFLSSLGALSAEVARTNRVIGGLTIWAVAWIVFNLVRAREAAAHLLWLQRGRAELGQQMLGDRGIDELGAIVLRVLGRYLDAGVAALYLKDEDGPLLRRVAGWADDGEPGTVASIALGEGLVGQAAADNRSFLLAPVAENYLRVRSALGQTSPAALLVVPITVDGRASGVIEIGLLHRGRAAVAARELLESLADAVGTSFRAARDRLRLQQLLEQTQRQSEALQEQQEELQAANEQLEESQSRLEEQQSELEETNAQLELQTARLEQQRDELVSAQSALRERAAEVERVSRYKSEFLANMSHELRTPLNSSMILAQVLAENRAGTLGEQDVHHAQIILQSNRDLLALINDILDLSKIEAGRLDLDVQPVSVVQIVEPLLPAVRALAEQRKLGFRVELDPSLPPQLDTDTTRVQQVLKNLLTNALKFTSSGEVVLAVLADGPDHVRFEVRDTGIGIAPEQQALIFEAFRQADGSISRSYGGTGLGLSICRQLATLLKGEIGVHSEPDRGSTFFLRIPKTIESMAGASRPDTPAFRPLPMPAGLVAANDGLPAAANGNRPDAAKDPGGRGQRRILIIEDDSRFAEVLARLCRDAGYATLQATTAADGLAQAAQADAVLLDIELPDGSGLAVLEQLKRQPATRHLPIHVLSVADHSQTALAMGAVGYAVKPLDREALQAALQRVGDRLSQVTRRVLVVSGDSAQRDAIGALLRGDDVDIVAVASAEEALKMLARLTFDCMVTEAELPDMRCDALLAKMAEGEQYAFPPVIVYGDAPLPEDEAQRLRHHGRALVVKRARTPERLLDEVSLFLHQMETRLSGERQRALRDARRHDDRFNGRTILLAEDDVRNVFSLTSVFEPLGARLVIARNGVEALQALEREPAIELVLMDLMMPEMDGLTAMRRIRADARFAALPVIALTACARPEDRVACIEAGASDYVAKPIDVDRLLSMCRVWLPERG